MLGKINLDIITDLTKLPQKQATAMAKIENPELTGGRYKVHMYIGDQPVNGTNYWFIAEQALSTRESDEHLVLIAVNEFDFKFEVVKPSIIKIL